MENTPSILIVDDDEISCKILSAMLKVLGYNSWCVANGQECIDALKLTQCDLVLLDWRMPVMSGAETIGLIRKGVAGEHHASIPVIAITADLIMSPREKCMQSGVDECLYKPLDLGKLSSVLKMKLINITAAVSDISVLPGVDSAINSHMQFIKSVTNSLTSNEQAYKIFPTDYTACQFGRWLSSELRSNSIFADVSERINSNHKQIHRLADEVFLLVSQNERTQAEKIAHDMQTLSYEMVTMLESLKSTKERC